MESHDIKITFPFEPGVKFDTAERIAFWDSPKTVQWFKDRGYTLYQRIVYEGEVLDTFHPMFPPDVEGNFVEGEYPYAHYDLETMDCPKAPLRVVEARGKVVFAQDSLKRHVAIKLVRDNTDEFRVLRFLSTQEPEVVKENCIIPVFELLPIEGFWFAVMPRWGSSVYAPTPCYLFEVVEIIHSMLKGLSYLHEHNITHGDINAENYLVNHFSDMYLDYDWRIELRSNMSLRYALFDFDFSVMLPPEANRKEFRLPYYRSWGTFNVSCDTAGGEYDYSPFVFDVGAMGVSLCHWHQHLTGGLPLLAPLLDKMTTWDLDRRFTASEALRFFEDRLSEVPEANLQVRVPDRIPSMHYTNYDRWKNVPPNFAERWSAYKTPPLSWRMRILRFIYRHSGNDHIVPQMRLLLFRFSLISRLVYKWINPPQTTI